MDKRICMDCKNEFPLTNEFFNSTNKNKSGFEPRCKNCHKLYRIKYNMQYKEKLKNNPKKLEQLKYNRIVSSQQRRAKERQLLATLTATEWEECLKYFEYKDAYTGMPLVDIAQDHVISVNHNGDYIKENIIPCNKEINTSKLDNNMLYWYKKQVFFSQDRLDKILAWMGEYKKFLYVPKEQRLFIEPHTSKSVQMYRIFLPDGKKYTLYYTDKNDKSKMTMLIKRSILDKWENYINEHWLWQHKFDPYRMNYEDKIKAFLDRCATFILLGELKNGMIMSPEREDLVRHMEMPVSCTASNIEDMFYSINNDGEYTIQGNNNNLIIDNEIMLKNQEPEQPQEKIHKKKREKIQNKYINSYHFKINELYFKPENKIRELYKLKNIDVYGDSIKNDTLDKEGFNKWKNKPFRNLYGENLYDVRFKTIPQNYGIINLKKPHICKWCYVYTDNTFSFEGNTYKISEQVKSYQIESVIVKNPISKDTYEDVNYSHDNILAIALCEDGYETVRLKNGTVINKPKKIIHEIHFYDMKINFIDKLVYNKNKDCFESDNLNKSFIEQIHN